MNKGRRASGISEISESPGGVGLRAFSGVGFRVWGLGFRVWGLGFKV